MNNSPDFSRALLLAFSLACACGRAEDDLDSDSFSFGSSASLDVLAASDLTARLVALDSLSTTVPADAAETTRARADALADCVAVEGVPEALTVSFSEGCALPTGQTLSGSVQLSFEASEGGTSATLVFDSLVVDGRMIDGTVAVSAEGGTVSAQLDLTTSRGSAAGTLALASEPMAVTLDGTMAVGSGLSLVFDGLRWEHSDCYPSDGTLTIDTGMLVQTVTFDADTALTGEVLVTQGPLTRTATLPAYGTCPKG
jgi:hypothetical protein